MSIIKYIFLFFIICIFVCLYIQYTSNLIIQKKMILPELSEYVDVTTIPHIFAIQEFYIYNPQAYSEAIENLNKFFEIYAEANEYHCLAGNNYNLMFNHKQKIINALNSIIFKLPTNHYYTYKLLDSLVDISNFLDTYLSKIENIQKEYIYDNGYDVNTKMLKNQFKVIPYNEVDDKYFTYHVNN